MIRRNPVHHVCLAAGVGMLCIRELSLLFQLLWWLVSAAWWAEEHYANGNRATDLSIAGHWATHDSPNRHTIRFCWNLQHWVQRWTFVLGTHASTNIAPALSFTSISLLWRQPFRFHDWKLSSTLPLECSCCSARFRLVKLYRWNSYWSGVPTGMLCWTL